MNSKSHHPLTGFPDAHALTESQRWLEQEGATLFPDQCALAIQRYDPSAVSLPPVTDPSLANAVEKRRREFSAGRIAAGIALKKLGARATSLPVGPGRNPHWPAGFTGSITHTAGLAVAVTARTATLIGIGIDLELTGAVQPDLWPKILRPAEIHFISQQPTASQSRLATILFSAKESFYKLQYPITGEWVDFHDAEISISGKAGQLELACRQQSVTRKLQRSRFSGRWLGGPEFSLTALWLPSAQPVPPTR